MAGIEFNSGQQDVTIDGPVSLEATDFPDNVGHNKLDQIDADIISGDNAIILGIEDNGNILDDVRTALQGLPTAQGLTDAQLRATPVPISGTVTVSNPTALGLTDAQLRASAVPVSVAGVSTASKQDDQSAILEDISTHTLQTATNVEAVGNDTATITNQLGDIGSDIQNILTGQTIATGKLDTLHSDNGTATTSPPTSGTGIIGWLRGIYDKIGALPTVVGLTDTQLRASAVPVTDTRTDYPSTGANTKLDTLHTDLGNLTNNTQTTKITNGTQAADTRAGDTGQNQLIIGESRKEITFTNGGLAATDVIGYLWASVQVVRVSGTLQPNSNNDNTTTLTAPYISANSSTSFPTTAAISASGIYYIPLLGRYFSLVSASFNGTVTVELHSTPPPAALVTSVGQMGSWAVSQSGTWTIVQGNGSSVVPWAVGGRLPTISLNAVVTSGTTPTVWDTGGCHSTVTMALHFTGTVATSSVALQGSMDNVTWFTLQTSTAVADAFVSNTGQPFRYYRANCTLLTGAAPVLTATIASVV